MDGSYDTFPIASLGYDMLWCGVLHMLGACMVWGDGGVG